MKTWVSSLLWWPFKAVHRLQRVNTTLQTTKKTTTFTHSFRTASNPGKYSIRRTVAEPFLLCILCFILLCIPFALFRSGISNNQNLILPSLYMINTFNTNRIAWLPCFVLFLLYVYRNAEENRQESKESSGYIRFCCKYIFVEVTDISRLYARRNVEFYKKNTLYTRLRYLNV